MSLPPVEISHFTHRSGACGHYYAVLAAVVATAGDTTKNGARRFPPLADRQLKPGSPMRSRDVVLARLTQESAL